jgi:phosphopantothenate-cysteine ligase/phosphopantothenoylcysteine decarboxylase/phosphopantothenate--cysteine ligase
MKILVTAGSTQMPIDHVRTISNIFKGKTGTSIAWEAAQDNEVTLIGNPSSNEMLQAPSMIDRERKLNLITYKTFDELEARMKEEITSGNYDVIIHSAAVSDYRPVDVLAPEPHDYYNKGLHSIKAAKVSSEYPEIYIKCIQTPKLVDYIREPWGFNGVLVKFKLQVGITKEELLEIARKSRTVSSADFIVANVLDDFNQPSPNMYICGDGLLVESTRADLPANLLKLVQEKYDRSKTVTKS